MRSDAIPVIALSGTPREIGRGHGEALRGVIADKIGRWHEAIGQSYGEAPGPFLRRFLAETDFRPAVARWTPDLLEEIAGLAEGAGLDEPTAFALQLMDEEWWYGKLPVEGHCSSLGFHRDGAEPATVLGQTMDLPLWHEGAQAVLRIEDARGGETLVVTTAGMVGLMGLTDRGLGLCVNTLLQLSRSRRGLPVGCVIRGVLARPDRPAALRFLGEVTHASGQNYLVGDRGGVTSVECSAGGAVAVPALGEDQRVWHTNHPLASSDRLPRREAAEEEAADGENSLARQALLARCLAPADGAALDVTALQATLARRDGPHPIAREADSADGFYSFAAVAYEIGEGLTLNLAGGAPSREAWRRLDLDPARLTPA